MVAVVAVVAGGLVVGLVCGGNVGGQIGSSGAGSSDTGSCWGGDGADGAGSLPEERARGAGAGAREGETVPARTVVSVAPSGGGVVVVVVAVVVVVEEVGRVVGARGRLVLVVEERSRAATLSPSSGLEPNGPPATRIPRSAPATRMRAATHRWFTGITD